MPPATHSAQVEADFMSQLFLGLDNDFSPSCLTPSHEPLTSKDGRAPTLIEPGRKSPDFPTAETSLTARDINLDLLLDGAEDWDWDNDISSPPRKKPVKPVT